jgi:hypothetical protein
VVGCYKAPENGGEARSWFPSEPSVKRNKPPVIKQSENTTPKQDGWWDTELIPEPEDNIQTQTTTSHWGRTWLSRCHWKTEEILARLPNHLARLRQSFCLNTHTRAGCWRSNTRTTRTEILLFLNLELFCYFVSLFVLFLIYLFISPYWVLCLFCCCC